MYSSSKTTVGLNTTPLPILALLAISLLINIVVGVALADTVITADSRKEIQNFGHNWLGTVLAQSSQRQKKRQTEKVKEKKQGQELEKKTEEKKVQKYNFEDDPFWSSELFGKFESASNSQDWFGSNKNPYSSKF